MLRCRILHVHFSGLGSSSSAIGSHPETSHLLFANILLPRRKVSAQQLSTAQEVSAGSNCFFLVYNEFEALARDAFCLSIEEDKGYILIHFCKWKSTSIPHWLKHSE